MKSRSLFLFGLIAAPSAFADVRIGLSDVECDAFEAQLNVEAHDMVIERGPLIAGDLYGPVRVLESSEDAAGVVWRRSLALGEGRRDPAGSNWFVLLDTPNRPVNCGIRTNVDPLIGATSQILLAGEPVDVDGSSTLCVIADGEDCAELPVGIEHSSTSYAYYKLIRLYSAATNEPRVLPTYATYSSRSVWESAAAAEDYSVANHGVDADEGGAPLTVPAAIEVGDTVQLGAITQVTDGKLQITDHSGYGYAVETVLGGGDYYTGASDAECDALEAQYLTGEKFEIPLGNVSGFIQPGPLGPIEVLDYSSGASNVPWLQGQPAWGRWLRLPTNENWFVQWQQIDPAILTPVTNCGARNTVALLNESGSMQMVTDCTIFTGDLCQPWPLWTINAYGRPGYLVKSYAYSAN